MSKQLTVRGLEDDIVRSLRILAASHGQSMEAEVRAILREAVSTSPAEETLKDLLAAMPNLGADADFGRDDSLQRLVEL